MLILLDVCVKQMLVEVQTLRVAGGGGGDMEGQHMRLSYCLQGQGRDIYCGNGSLTLSNLTCLTAEPVTKACSIPSTCIFIYTP